MVKIECPHCGYVMRRGESTKIRLAKAKREAFPEEYMKYAVAMGFGKTAVYTPSGRCPVRLRKHTRQAVTTWAFDVVDSGKPIGKLYLPPALKYYAAQFFDRFSPEYKKICKFLDSWFHDLIKDIELNNEKTV